MSDDVKALIESIIDDQAELHIYQDEGYVKNSDVLAEKIVAALEASVQARAVVDRLAAIEAIHGAVAAGPGVAGKAVDSLFASGILQDAAEVEARGLERYADERWGAVGARRKEMNSMFNEELRIRERAQQVREGN